VVCLREYRVRRCMPLLLAAARYTARCHIATLVTPLRASSRAPNSIIGPSRWAPGNNNIRRGMATHAAEGGGGGIDLVEQKKTTRKEVRTSLKTLSEEQMALQSAAINAHILDALDHIFKSKSSKSGGGDGGALHYSTISAQLKLSSRRSVVSLVTAPRISQSLKVLRVLKPLKLS